MSLPPIPPVLGCAKRFRKVADGVLPEGHLLRRVGDLPGHLWKKDTWRQDHPSSPHKDTETVYLKMPNEITERSVFNDLNSDWLDAAFSGVVRRMLPEIMKKVTCSNFKIGRVMLVKLKPGGHIEAHRDEGAYARAYDRLHLAVQSEDGNIFRCEDEYVWMHPGSLWAFSHKEEHEVWNNSKSDRVHLIIDWCVTDSPSGIVEVN